MLSYIITQNQDSEDSVDEYETSTPTPAANPSSSLSPTKRQKVRVNKLCNEKKLIQSKKQAPDKLSCIIELKAKCKELYSGKDANLMPDNNARVWIIQNLDPFYCLKKHFSNNNDEFLSNYGDILRSSASLKLYAATVRRVSVTFNN